MLERLETYRTSLTQTAFFINLFLKHLVCINGNLSLRGSISQFELVGIHCHGFEMFGQNYVTG